MRLLKYLFLLLALFCSNYCQAQQFDSVRVDTSNHPGPTYVRIKFPHDGFRLTHYVQRDFNCYPPITAINFVFKECTGTVGSTYYDTTLSLWIYPPAFVQMRLLLDVNTWDTTCVLRPSYVLADSIGILCGTFPGTQSATAQNKETHSISVYPNPVINHRLTIETDASGSKPTRANFYSLQGNKVATYTLSESKTEITLPLHLPAGNYLLLLQTADGAVERKMITVQ